MVHFVNSRTILATRDGKITLKLVKLYQMRFKFCLKIMTDIACVKLPRSDGSDKMRIRWTSELHLQKMKQVHVTRKAAETK